ncbi:hypothetical protein S40293_02593 [Stachybotrys chartarum IBT 40293]|nr:hypothetical protein S40293_02593 [Stachybotrys chartarum IBT 40293]
MSNASTSWAHLPPNIRHEVLSILPGLGGVCSLLATVSREWQSAIEPLNFAEISLTLPRLSNPVSAAFLFRKRSHIRYTWFRVELKQYGCGLCAPEDGDSWGLDSADNRLIADAFQSLFSTLSTWEPWSNLVLDISVYSPSNTRHWFKYLSFYPDTHVGECRPSGGEQGIPIDDPAHGWAAGRQTVAPKWHAIEKAFDEIMGEGPFEDEEPEMQWWQTLPLVPAVAVVLFRNRTLIELLAETKLSKLTIFENFNQSYPGKYFECPAFRQPTPAVSRTLARASLQLATLSASFMIDASYFFESRGGSREGENLTYLALTSRVLTDDANVAETRGMLRDAAAAALAMPKLETLELWNGSEGLAMLFRYQEGRDRQPAIITLRGTSELVLGSAVTQAWDAVALRHGHDRVVVRSFSVDLGTIRCHGDAICQLGLSTEVIKPVSLRQMLNEHELRAGPVK